MTTTLTGRTIVVTGAAGRIATALRPGLRRAGARLRLSDVHPVAGLGSHERWHPADLTRPEQLAPLMADADAVVHLGGVADEAPFDHLAAPNLHGAFHVFEAARRAGVARVIYASSNRVTGFHPTTASLAGEEPVRPDGLYGASKAFGEALGRMYADRFGLDVVALRIGSFEDRPTEPRHLSTWLSPADALRLFVAALTAPKGFGYLVLYGVSANTRTWWPPTGAWARIGYAPQDDAETFAGELGDQIGTRQGDPYTDPGYGGWAG